MAARPLLPLLVALLAMAVRFSEARAAPASSLESGTTDALQVLADLTLIDGACPKDVVNFGIVFRFAGKKGVPEVAMMPGGSRRSEFETVLRARKANFDRDELCGEIAENYAEALPGSVSFRPETGARP